MQGSPRTGNSPPFWPVVDLLLVGWLAARRLAWGNGASCSSSSFWLWGWMASFGAMADGRSATRGRRHEWSSQDASICAYHVTPLNRLCSVEIEQVIDRVGFDNHVCAIQIISPFSSSKSATTKHASRSVKKNKGRCSKRVTKSAI
jgi:hypothetical protein